MFLIALKRTAVLLILAVVGFVCTKCGIIDKERNKGLADVLMYVLTPAVFINSLQITYDAARLKGFVLVFVSVAAAYIVNNIVSIVLIKSHDEDTERALQFSAAFPNVAFMGIPMVQGIIGEEGVFYLAAGVASVNLLLFTLNIYRLEKDRSKVSLKAMITSPTVLAVLVGLVLFGMQIILPEVLLTPISMLGNTVTPIAMLLAGYSIANTDFRDMTNNLQIALGTVLKLFLFPLAYAFVMSLIPGYTIPKLAAVICLACPTGSYAIFLSLKCGRNDSVASQMFTYTTVLSCLSIPAVMWIIQFFGYHL